MASCRVPGLLPGYPNVDSAAVKRDSWPAHIGSGRPRKAFVESQCWLDAHLVKAGYKDSAAGVIRIADSMVDAVLKCSGLFGVSMAMTSFVHVSNRTIPCILW